MGMYVFISRGYIPGSKNARSDSNSLCHLRSCQQFEKLSSNLGKWVDISHSYQHYYRSLTSLPYQSLLFSVFLIKAILVVVNWLITVVWFAFLNDWRCWASPHVLTVHLHVFFWRMSIQILCLVFFSLTGLFFCYYWLGRIIYIFWKQVHS